MEILKRLLRDYLVPSCPAISQNIYMYPRASEVIETAGQVGTCPQKVLANDASFVCRRNTEPLPKERLNTSIDTSKKNDNIKTSPRKSINLQGEKSMPIHLPLIVSVF